MKSTERPQIAGGLYLILTDPRDGYEALTRWAVMAELPAIQLRYKGDDERRHLALARKMRQLTAGSRTRFIVNDRPDIAVAVSADGIHVGQDDMPPAEVRRVVGDHMLIGLSTHNLKQVEKADGQPVDYIGFGPLYATTSKEKPDPVVGPHQLASAAKISRHPIVAIGGLTLERIKKFDIAHCNNVAVITAVSNSSDPMTTMQTINQYVWEEKKNAS